MSGRYPGPLCLTLRWLEINDGTLCGQPSPTPGSLGMECRDTLFVNDPYRSVQQRGPTITVPGGEIRYTYFLWARQSLNRAGAHLDEIDKDGADLRRAVRKFRAKTGLPPGETIDTRVQNALIKVNERDWLYVLWLQQALNIIFVKLDGSLTVPETGVMDRKTRDTIRKFQEFDNSNGQNLAVDGVIGPKTERRLAEFYRLPPPGRQFL